MKISENSGQRFEMRRSEFLLRILKLDDVETFFTIFAYFPIEDNFVTRKINSRTFFVSRGVSFVASDVD